MLGEIISSLKIESFLTTNFDIGLRGREMERAIFKMTAYIIGTPILILFIAGLAGVITIIMFGDFYEYVWKLIKKGWRDFQWWIVGGRNDNK